MKNSGNDAGHARHLELKYGLNPGQGRAELRMSDGSPLPFTVLNGRAGYINLLDALNAWQLVRELRAATGLPAAASFKHVSPAGAAIGLPLSAELACSYRVEGEELSPLATAYVRARGCDRLSSFGDFAALSDCCDISTARQLRREVSDGVVAPGYTAEALALLKEKKGGQYCLIQIDADYEPPALETREVFGVLFQQERHRTVMDASCLSRWVSGLTAVPAEARRDLLIALITAKYTQSNSVCLARDGQTIGVGAGQQSRLHCTRLAGDKADIWLLRQSAAVRELPFRSDLSRAAVDNLIDRYLSPRGGELCADGQWPEFFRERPRLFSPEEKRAFLDSQEQVSLASDAFFPFADNIERAAASGVRYIAQPGGSLRDDEVIAACDRLGIAMCFTGLRLFHH